MPYRSKVPCKHPGCAELLKPRTKYCEKHKSRHPEEIRSDAARGYDAAWQKARKQYLSSRPLKKYRKGGAKQPLKNLYSRGT